jgi:hypothetical protein
MIFLVTAEIEIPDITEFLSYWEPGEVARVLQEDPGQIDEEIYCYIQDQLNASGLKVTQLAVDAVEEKWSL